MLLPLALGLAVTCVVAGLYTSGALDRPELQTLDMHFRRVAGAPENPDIVHIDIDDGSLGQLGRWPWPRELLAGIVDVLSECGADAVALDIIMPEPQDTRFISLAYQPYYFGGVEAAGGGAPEPVFDDVVLARAIKSAGRVFVPMHIRLQQAEGTRLGGLLAPMLADNSDLSAEQAKQALVAAGELPQTLGEADAEEFAKEYLAARSLAELQRFTVSADGAPGLRRKWGGVVPPLVTFSRSAYRTGFVTVRPDTDGTVRRIPLLAGREGHIWPQFALVLAAEKLATSHGGSYEIGASESAVTITCPDGFVREIPVDAEGMLLINWIRRRDDNTHPRHLPAHYIGDVFRWRRQVGSLSRDGGVRRSWLTQLIGRARQLQAAGLSDLCFEIEALLQQAQDSRADQAQLRLTLYRAALYQPGWTGAADVQAQLDLARRREEAAWEQAAGKIDQLIAGVRTQAAGAGDTSLAVAAIEACDVLTTRIPEDRRSIEARIAERLADIRKRVAGKICMVGSTATGAADFVPTPISARAGAEDEEAGRTPGVEVHSNIVNTIVSGAFIRQAGRATNLAVILLAGLIVTVLAARLPVLQAGPLAVALAAGYAVFNGLVVFGVWRIWLTAVAPLAAMLGGFLIVTAYRQLTEERAKRRIRGLFAHALSPALVDRLIEDPSLARLGGEKRVLSCFFSDLQGFTSLSERLGEQKTVQLLNRYFDRMTDVIQQRHGGYLNKFLGDGIFVFFGAPVLQDDHAARAIQAALDCQDEVTQLNGALAEEFGSAVQLRCRIGVTTGEAMVGNCGSTQRMDYTAIGDSVNLASRLESANKTFHTLILVSQAAWDARGDYDILARPLGKILVVGKTEPVDVWNVLRRGMDAGDDERWAVEQFVQGLARFQAREFAAAAKAFEEVLQLDGEDGAAKIYLDLCREYQADPPSDDWDGAVQLASK